MFPLFGAAVAKAIAALDASPPVDTAIADRSSPSRRADPHRSGPYVRPTSSHSCGLAFSCPPGAEAQLIRFCHVTPRVSAQRRPAEPVIQQGEPARRGCPHAHEVFLLDRAVCPIILRATLLLCRTSSPGAMSRRRREQPRSWNDECRGARSRRNVLVRMSDTAACNRARASGLPIGLLMSIVTLAVVLGQPRAPA